MAEEPVGEEVEHAFEDDGAAALEPEPAPEPEPTAAEEIEITQTPQGAKRGGITESDELDYRNPRRRSCCGAATTIASGLRTAARWRRRHGRCSRCSATSRSRRS